jgi:hypothetical protein
VSPRLPVRVVSFQKLLRIRAAAAAIVEINYSHPPHLLEYRKSVLSAVPIMIWKPMSQTTMKATFSNRFRYGMEIIIDFYKLLRFDTLVNKLGSQNNCQTQLDRVVESKLLLLLKEHIGYKRGS